MNVHDIKTITPQRFAKYGTVLAFTEGCEKDFEILVEEPANPWRMAVYRPPQGACEFLENHPESLESFEPVRGVSLLLVAENAAPERMEVFLLDTPVCLFKGIWHNVIALSGDVLLRVTENLRVSEEFYPLSPAIQAACVAAETQTGDIQ